MKKIFIISALIAFLSGFNSCKNPAEDFGLHISPKIYNYVMEVQLSDIATPDDPFEGDVTIEIIGEDAEHIYNIDGTKNFAANFGYIQLITPKPNEPTAGDPLAFSVVIKSNGYRENRVNFLVQEEQVYVPKKAFLLNENNLPNGLISSSGSASIGSNGELTQEYTFNTTPAGTSAPLEITIPTGIKFMNRDGTQLVGSSLEIEVISFDNASSTAMFTMPNNSGIDQLVEENGELRAIGLDPRTTFDISMNIGNQEIKGFGGNGIEMVFALPDEAYNVTENRLYESGDKVNLVSFSEGDNFWKSDGLTTITEINGKLVVSPKVKHLSTFSIIPLENSSSNYYINVVNNSTEVDIERTINIQINPATTNTVRTFTLNIKPGESQSLRRHDFDQAYADVLLDAQKGFYHYIYSMGTLLWEKFDELLITDACVNCAENSLSNDYDITYDIEPSSDIGTITIGLTPKRPSVQLGYKVSCPELTSEVPAGSKLFYRPSGTSESFKELETFTSDKDYSKLQKFYGLEDGKTYDFKYQFIAIQFETTLTIEDGKIYDLELNAGQCNTLGFIQNF